MSELTVGIAHNSFFYAFQRFFPQLFVINNLDDVRKADLIIFPGGEDIHPSIYGEEINGSVGINVERDSKELSVIDWWISSGKSAKLFGVCRGHQLLNAYFGGKLIQDIRPGHSSIHGYNLYEPFYEKIFPQVTNSLHHQGVTKIGENMTPLTEYGGVIESTISSDDKIFSVQFHPEFMSHTPMFDFLNKWVKGEI